MALTLNYFSCLIVSKIQTGKYIHADIFCVYHLTHFVNSGNLILYMY